MVKVKGIGGVFIYADDSKALSEWYARHFGREFTPDPNGKTCALEFFYRNDKDPQKRERTGFAIFTSKQPLPPERSEFMVNYRVDNLEKIRNPEGNRIELGEPL